MMNDGHFSRSGLLQKAKITDRFPHPDWIKWSVCFPESCHYPNFWPKPVKSKKNQWFPTVEYRFRNEKS